MLLLYSSDELLSDSALSKSVETIVQIFNSFRGGGTAMFRLAVVREQGTLLLCHLSGMSKITSSPKRLFPQLFSFSNGVTTSCNGGNVGSGPL